MLSCLEGFSSLLAGLTSFTSSSLLGLLFTRILFSSTLGLFLEPFGLPLPRFASLTCVICWGNSAFLGLFFAPLGLPLFLGTQGCSASVRRFVGWQAFPFNVSLMRFGYIRVVLGIKLKFFYTLVFIAFISKLIFFYRSTHAYHYIILVCICRLYNVFS